MYSIKTLNKISQSGLSRLGTNFTYSDNAENPDAILVRSASMHDMELPKNLLAIARAGAGVNNIPINLCSEKGIVVFNTPGANANAVKELVIAGLLLSSRRIVSGIEWAKKLKGNGDQVSNMIEKGKSSFVGPEIKGKSLGIIGLGAIGALVANAASALGMRVYGYDPFLSVDAALRLSPSITRCVELDQIFAESDYISIHVPLTPDTEHIICKKNIDKMKDGIRILNYSRADLVNLDDVLTALKSGKISAYITDFATDNLLCEDGVIVTPHLGASTPESEENCAVMAVDEVKDYLLNGNIKNSVNFPNINMDRTGDIRYCILHRNVPTILNRCLSVLSDKGANVENMENKSRKEYAYSVIDVSGTTEILSEEISRIDGVVKVRVIK